MNIDIENIKSESINIAKIITPKIGLLRKNYYDKSIKNEIELLYPIVLSVVYKNLSQDNIDFYNIAKNMKALGEICDSSNLVDMLDSLTEGRSESIFYKLYNIHNKSKKDAIKIYTSSLSEPCSLIINHIYNISVSSLQNLNNLTYENNKFKTSL